MSPLPRLALFVAAALGLFSAATPDALAQGRQVPASAGQLELSFAPIVKRVAPAVVERAKLFEFALVDVLVYGNRRVQTHIW